MNSLRFIAQRNFHQLRRFHNCSIRRAEAAAAATTEPLTIPPSEDADKPVDPKINKLVNDITALNLLEVAELSDLLKKRLNLPDVAPMMPVMAQAAQASDNQGAHEQKVKSLFTVKLLQFDDKQKIALIKEMKNIMSDMNLVQAKKFIESAPTTVKADISQEEAEKLKQTLTAVGAEIEIV